MPVDHVRVVFVVLKSDQCFSQLQRNFKDVIGACVIPTRIDLCLF